MERYNYSIGLIKKIDEEIMEKQNAIVIIGSPRKNGNTTILTNELLELLKDNFEIEKIFLKD